MNTNTLQKIAQKIEYLNKKKAEIEKMSPPEPDYRCPAHPNARVCGTETWHWGYNNNPDAKNPISIYACTSLWCAVCGREAKETNDSKNKRREWKKWQENEMSKLSKALNALWKKFWEINSLEQESREMNIIEKAKDKLKITESLLEWYKKLPIEEQERICWKADPYEGFWGNIENARNPEYEIARAILDDSV